MKQMFSYIVMVSLPLIGVFGTLPYGRSLEVPASVGGEWAVETDDGTSSLCARAAGKTDGGLLSVSQSGQHVSLTFICEVRLSLSGEVRKSTLIAIGYGTLPPGTDNTCNTGKMSLNATLEHSAGKEYLAGTLTAIGCPGLRTIAFRALRQRQTSSFSPSHSLDKAD